MHQNEKQHCADAINLLTRYLGVRDIPSLDCRALRETFDLPCADLLILFGGAIPFAADVAAWAMTADSPVASRLMVVGGVGHTTASLREKFRARFPQMATEGKSEAELYAAYLAHEYGLKNLLLETKSTNCGNNVTYALARLKAAGLLPRNILILQEPAMQRRMAEGFRKALADVPHAPRIISYAPYRPTVIVKNDALAYAENFWGLWPLSDYVTLLLGDVARLRDDENGYGPRGKGYLLHVDVPPVVLSAFQLLQESGLGKVRTANAAFRS